MQNPEELFAPIINQYVWSVKRGHGSFLTLEFGKPHLAVREPIKRQNRNFKSSAVLRQRRISCSGQWSFWVTYSYWKILTKKQSCSYQDNYEIVDNILQTIDGQKIINLKFNSNKRLLTIVFDLGGQIQISPLDINDQGDDLWVLRDNEAGLITSCLNNGNLKTSKCQKLEVGSITVVKINVKPKK